MLPNGLALLTIVGALWAVLYAFDFWFLLAWRPVWQGLALAVLPALLFMYPQPSS